MIDYSMIYLQMQEDDGEAYDFFNDGYPGDAQEYAEFEGWEDLVK